MLACVVLLLWWILGLRLTCGLCDWWFVFVAIVFWILGVLVACLISVVVYVGCLVVVCLVWVIIVCYELAVCGFGFGCLIVFAGLFVCLRLRCGFV